MIDFTAAEALFFAALDRPAGPERAEFLNEACGADADLRNQVEKLLAAQPQVGNFMNKPAPLQAATIDETPIGERPGSIIGPYKLMEQIGEGGFGLVFVAEQQQPVRRKVALKIIKPGMDTRDVIARFEAERQALALMDHPNIARVFDAGTTAGDRPYFVMELVKGIPIVEYCDQQQFTARERLELFLSVCQAVQHAHGKGIIHRDLKPSNILVAPHDGVPVVKVIDFGVAKAIGQQLTDKTIYTRFTQMIGTPLYMSPEQAEVNALDVDTRSDVYSLGVLLYELLTGTTPFDRKRFATAAYDEIRRIIREEEPPRPSTRLSTMGESLSKVSSQRKTEPAKLSALVKGDLDWIVMKALEKERNRRYDTASAFAADVRRFLAEEPIEARPPSTLYRFRKLARRNKVALLTAGLVAAALVLGTVASTWQAVRATVAERAARSSEEMAQDQKREADDAKDQAEKRRDELARLNENLRRANYIADMNLARVAWDENNLERTRELLDKHRPKPGEVDLRGFEWHYLRRLFHGDMLTIKAHGGWVTGVAFRPDGKCLVTSGTMEPPRGMKFFKGVTSEIKLWDAATGQPLRFQLSGPTGAVDRMALFDDKLPQIALNWDGTLVAAHYSNHAIRVLNLVTGDLVTLEGPAKHSVAGFNFSHDGKRLVSVYLVDGPTLDSPSLIKIWDLATGKALLTLDQLPHVVGGPSISPNGRHLAAAFSHLGVVKVWDATTGNEAYSCKYAGGLVYHAIFSPDGKRLAASGDKGVQFWDAGTHEPGAALPSDSRLVLGMAFSPDGKRLATGSVEGAVDVWDTRSGQKFWTFKGHSGNVIWLSFSSDGARLATGGADGTVRVWDTSGQRDAVSITKADSTLEQPELSPDGQTLLSWGPRKIVRLWDSATGKPRGGPIEIPQTEVSHDWSGDGKRLYLADAGKTIRVVDTVSGKVIRTFQVDAEAKEYDIAISADEKWCAHPGPGNTIKVRNVQTGALLRTLKVVDERGLLLVFSPNGSRLLGLDQDGVLKFWEVATGNEIATTRLSDMYITHTRFSPDGKRLAVVGNLSQFATGEVRILDAENLREIWSLKGHTLNVLDVAFSPDGQRLATASADRTARIWDLTTGKEILKLSGYPRLWSLRFVSNGRRLIIASTDLTIHVWDATPMPDEGSAEARNR